MPPATTITNVAAGTDDADAVNYSQLKQQSAAARTEVAAGTNIKDVVKTTGANGQERLHRQRQRHHRERRFRQSDRHCFSSRRE